MNRLNFERLSFFVIGRADFVIGRADKEWAPARVTSSRMCEEPSTAACWALAMQSNIRPVQIMIVAGLKPMLMRTAFLKSNAMLLLDADWSSDDVLLASALYALKHCTLRRE